MDADKYDIIIRYVENDMSPDERAQFEEALLTDESLRAALEDYRDVSATLQSSLQPDEEQKAFSQTISQLNQEYFKPQAKIISLQNRRRMIWAVAASIAIIFTIIVIPWRSNLYDKYADIQMTSIEERGGKTDSLLQLATTYFNEEKFDKSLEYLEKLTETEPSNSYYNFFYGVALQQNGQTAESRTVLEPVFNGQSLLKDKAGYYIALSYLKEKNTDACLEWLNKLPANSSVSDKVEALKLELK